MHANSDDARLLNSNGPCRWRDPYPRVDVAVAAAAVAPVAFCARPARLAEHAAAADVKIKEKGFKIIFILLTNYHMNR